MLAQKENGKGVGGECVPEEMFGLPSRRRSPALPKGHLRSRRRLTCWAGMRFVGNVLRAWGALEGVAVATAARDAHLSLRISPHAVLLRPILNDGEAIGYCWQPMACPPRCHQTCSW